MARFTGTSGDDPINGTNGNDKFKMSQGGNDLVNGKAGNDAFKFGAAFNAFDTVNGGEGNDKLLLKGDYQIPTVLQPTSISGVELIKFGNGFNYNFALAAGNVGVGEVLTLDASKLGPLNAVGIDASAVTEGQVDFIGGQGNDIFYGGSNTGVIPDIDASRGGNDQITLHSNGSVYFGDEFTADDQVTNTFVGFGGVYLDGDYSAGVVLNATTLVGLAALAVNPGNDQDYNLTLDDATGPAGHFFIVTSSDQTGTGDLTINGAAETDAILNIQGAAGNDTFTGGALADTFYTRTGRDTVNGGDGDDLINADMVGDLNANDRFNGGAGTDTVKVYGAPGFDVTLDDLTLSGIEVLIISVPDQEAKLTLADGNVGFHETLTVEAHDISGPASARIDGSAELDGTLIFDGGIGADTFIGGQFSTTMTGGLAADKLVAGGGTDTFVYTSVTESRGAGYDRIVGLDWSQDKIDVMNAVTGIAEKLENGTVNLATFEADLKNAIGNDLGANQVMLFQAEDGDQAGKKFLVVDQNGNAGYQGVQDLVIWLDGAVGPINIEGII